MTWPTRSTLALIGFGIAVVGFTTYALTRPGPGGHVQSAVAESGVVAATPSSSAAPVSVLATAASRAPATSLHVALPKGPVSAVVFGDSYVAGVGASSTQDAFIEKAMSQLGWKATYFARNDSGYCTSHSVDYLQRLKALQAGPAPTVFLLEGGVNDVGCDAAILQAQIAASIAQIKTAYPKAALIVLGPVVPSKYNADQLLPVDQALDVAATVAGAPYISPLTELWLTSANDSRYMSTDGLHPNQAGYAYLTTLLLRDLEQITAR